MAATKRTPQETIDLLARYARYVEASNAKESARKATVEAEALFANVSITPEEIEDAIKINEAISLAS